MAKLLAADQLLEAADHRAWQNELNQLKQTHASLTGPRGMQALLPLVDAQRNYLPKDWAEVAKVLQGQSAQYGALANSVNALVDSRAVLTAADLAANDAAGADECRAGAATGGRACGDDARGLRTGERSASRRSRSWCRRSAVRRMRRPSSDLQGRIDAEQAMLENEQAKLHVADAGGRGGPVAAGAAAARARDRGPRATSRRGCIRCCRSDRAGGGCCCSRSSGSGCRQP